MNELTLDPQPTTEVYRIPLTQGQFAIVDEDDFEELSQFKWCAGWNKEIQGFYAKRSGRKSLGERSTIQMHRQIMKAPDGMMVDHRNHSGLDNRKENLRLATNSQNQHNSRAHRRSKSGLKGAHWNSNEGKWTARIKSGKIRRHLGYFDTAEEASAAYIEASRQLHGDFCVANSSNIRDIRTHPTTDDTRRLIALLMQKLGMSGNEVIDVAVRELSWRHGLICRIGFRD